MKKQIQSTLAAPDEVSSLLSVTVDAQSLRLSDSLIGKELSEIINSIHQVKIEIITLKEESVSVYLKKLENVDILLEASNLNH